MAKVIKGENDLETLYPEIIADWDYEVNDKKPEEYVGGSAKKVSWICRTCGTRWKAEIRHRTRRKTGCPECAKKIRGELKHKYALENNGSITNTLLLKEWDYTKNKKGPEEYTPCSNESVFWICS